MGLADFPIHHSPFTIHHSPFTIHHSAFTIQHSGEVIDDPHARFQHARRPCRRQARSGDRRACHADLPDDLLCLR
ncbi:hypothetical protein MES5069_230245 [Mesorhizobium escarrei]|uniref:Uncharacterized protein n=1 Tax=Mesorhizobium escarrei TaxID=666018 RepID=A0ABN8JP67_9HYPH|nr:hypothetical protein MES5069_230245 [Mesorhizobium escarrei]